jgi:formate/nitrite transporter FocA (FNT family)
MAYGGRSDWGMVGLAVWVFFQGRYVSTAKALSLWIPFLIVVVLALGLGLGVGTRR